MARQVVGRSGARIGSLPSGSPTSARRRSSGSARPAGRSPMRSSWQSRITAPACERLRPRPRGAVPDRTGLPLDAYFSGPKIAAILDAVPGARNRAERGELAFGTVDRSCCGASPAARREPVPSTRTSRTPAAHSFSTSSPRLGRGAARVVGSRAVLPEVRPSSGLLGETYARALRPLDPDRGARGRPTGGDVRPGLFRGRAGEEHLRHRGVPAAEHRLGGPRLLARPPVHGRMAARAGGSAAYALEGSVFSAARRSNGSAMASV